MGNIFLFLSHLYHSQTSQNEFWMKSLLHSFLIGSQRFFPGFNITQYRPTNMHTKEMFFFGIHGRQRAWHVYQRKMRLSFYFSWLPVRLTCSRRHCYLGLNSHADWRVLMDLQPFLCLVFPVHRFWQDQLARVQIILYEKLKESLLTILVASGGLYSHSLCLFYNIHNTSGSITAMPSGMEKLFPSIWFI
jgi:hypothetical protein